MENYQFDVVKSFKYLTEPNAYIYRAIMKFLYDKHRQFETFGATLKDIHQMLLAYKVVAEDFSLSRVEESMKALENWEAIRSHQSQEKGLSLEERKKKRFIYRITDVGVEIENLLSRLVELEETMIISMDSRKFIKLYRHLEIFKDYEPIFPNETVIEVWKNVFDVHNDLVKNAAWYLSQIQEAEKTNLFNTELFLEFKNNFIQYLGTYITELNKNKYKIIRLLESVSDEHIIRYIDKIIEFNRPLSIFREDVSEERMKFNYQNMWVKLKDWYLYKGDTMSEVERLSNKTNEAISMIVSYANRLTDTMTNSQSKLDDYRSAAARFKDCSTVKDAHKLFASIFGAAHSRSIYAKDMLDIVEDGNFTSVEEVWGTSSTPLEIPNMSNRGPKGTTKQRTMNDNKAKQREQLLEKMKERKEEQDKLAKLIKDGKIIFSELDVLEPYQRKVILKWLSRSPDLRKTNNKKSIPFRTETGLLFRVQKRSENKIQVTCTDGTLTSPDIEIIFEGEL
ncbi:TIGR02677 family protein [Psychrobacillus sp. NPDC058041]|uniref:TIGR02677 family protein n=1 Tax=Psychrobacillus sp. NPDC058041 TaxID=3346310 RepID=UPI0036DE0BC8